MVTSSQYHENSYQEQFNTSNPSNYWISFEINQGQASETYLMYYGSVSFWWRLNFQGTPNYVGYNPQFGSSSISPFITGLLVAFMFLAYSIKSLKETAPFLQRGRYVSPGLGSR
jgi:hypothetical protein